MATKKVATAKKPRAKKAAPKKQKTSSAPGESAEAHKWLMETQGLNQNGNATDMVEPELPEEVHDIPDEDDTGCGPTEEDLLKATGKDPKTGRFLPGNSGGPGKPKGSRNKIAEEFFSDFYAHWQENGKEAIAWVFQNRPDIYFNGAIKILPSQVDVRVSEFAELTESALDDRINQMAKELSTALAILKPQGAVQ